MLINRLFCKSCLINGRKRFSLTLQGKVHASCVRRCLVVRSGQWKWRNEVKLDRTAVSTIRRLCTKLCRLILKEVKEWPPNLISSSLCRGAPVTKVWRKSVNRYWRYRGNIKLPHESRTHGQRHGRTTRKHIASAGAYRRRRLKNAQLGQRDWN